MAETISIIIPIYNVELYLERCLDSVSSQSYQEWECIMVNDGSTDGSEEIAKRYVSKDKRFRLYSQENQGLSAARNRGIEESQGEYLTFLDSDDAWHPEFLSVLYRCLREKEAEVSVCCYTRFHSEIPEVENVGGCETIHAEEAVKRVLVDRIRSMIVAWGKLYRRILFEGIRYPVGMYHEDEFVTYKIFSKCTKIVVTELPYYYYFMRTGSITSRFQLKRLDLLRALDESRGYIKKEMPALYGEVCFNYVFNLAIAYYRVSTLKGEGNVKKRLRETFRKEWGCLPKAQQTAGGNIKKIAVIVFRVCPPLFCLGAAMYLRMDRDE